MSRSTTVLRVGHGEAGQLGAAVPEASTRVLQQFRFTTTMASTVVQDTERFIFDQVVVASMGFLFVECAVQATIVS